MGQLLPAENENGLGDGGSSRTRFNQEEVSHGGQGIGMFAWI